MQTEVTGGGTVSLSSNMTLTNTLLVPSLSTKLLSVSQICEELNCVVLMYPNFCLFQDILTKEIIGRGGKKGRLYYLEDMKSSVNLVHGVPNNKNKVVVWNTND